MVTINNKCKISKADLLVLVMGSMLSACHRWDHTYKGVACVCVQMFGGQYRVSISVVSTSRSTTVNMFGVERGPFDERYSTVVVS